MFWWVATVVSIVAALLFHYFFASKIRHLKETISIKSLALRDVRDEGQKLDEQEIDLQKKQISIFARVSGRFSCR